MADYVAELRKLVLHCQFGGYLMEALRDCLVHGLPSETQQKRLLAEHDLTFYRALPIAQSMEAANRDAHTLRGSDMTQQGAISQIPQQHPVLKAPGDSSQARECYRCGSSTHVSGTPSATSARKRGILQRFITPNHCPQASKGLLEAKDGAAESLSGSILQKR